MPVRSLAGLAAFLLVLTALAAPAPTAAADDPVDGDAPALDVRRLAGADRVETAVEISADVHADGADAAVVARADAYADALAGGPLAGAVDGPVLLTDGDALSEATADELTRLAPDTVYLLGGDAALAPAVESDVADLLATGEIHRLEGEDRFGTAAAVAAELGAVAGDDLAAHAYVAKGIDEDPTRGWPDPLAVSALAAHESAPILLAHEDDVPEVTVEALDGLAIADAVLVGGEAALTPAVSAELESAGLDVSRVAGADRFATSAAIADRAVEAGLDPDGVWLATGRDWPDGLTAGPAAAASGDPLLLVDGDNLRGLDAARTWFANHAGLLERVTAAGGPAAISNAVLGALTDPDGDGVRGVWVHLFDDALKSQASIEEVVDVLADAGADTIFAQVARRHDAYYTSDVLPATPDPNLEAGLDVLDALTEAAGAAGLEVHAWISVAPTDHWVYNDLPEPDGWLAAEHGQDAPEEDRWVTRRGADGPWSDYLDPALPEVREHVADIVTELAERYPIDGVHLDYVRYQSPEHGYHPDALERYRDETGATGTPDPDDPAWSDWRRDQTRAVIERAAEALDATGTDVELNAATITWSPAPVDTDDGFEGTRAYNDTLQDWQGWAADGLLDAVVPMTYFRDHNDAQAADYAGWLAFQSRLAAASEVAVIPGVGGYLNAPEATLEQVRDASATADGAVIYSYQAPYDADRADADSPDVWDDLGARGWGR